MCSYPSALLRPIFQECERMNILTKEMRRSLKELDLGLKGELTITNDMEDLGNSLFFDQARSLKKLESLGCVNTCVSAG